MELIDKSAVVAEIEKLQKYRRGVFNEIDQGFEEGRDSAFDDLLSFLDSLKVEDVDLDEEFDRYCENLYLIDLENEPYAELFECAKHFYELGLKTQKGE